MVQFNVDLTNCEREPIHILGHIQSYGYLVAIVPDTYTIAHVSENIVDLTGLPAETLLGKSVDQLLVNTDVPVAILTELLNVSLRSASPESMNPHVLTIKGINWHLVLHQYQELVLLEWEPAGGNTNEGFNQKLIAQALTEVQTSQTLNDLWKNTAERVKKIIGFDRVMVYRFEPDWHGQVVAEAKNDDLEPFLGLHYPASDIPRQARKLYQINLVRLIADATSKPVRILSAPDWPADRPLDLTHSGLRAVSPIHIEYLKNMGVQASMSISLLYKGELWGLISCHNYTPRLVSYPDRQAAKFVSQLLSTALEFRKGEQDQTALQQCRQNGQLLHQQLVQEGDVVKALFNHPVTALDLTTATGAALLFNDQLYRLGQTPDEVAIRQLIDWLKENATESFFQTSQLPGLYPEAKSFRFLGAGLLAIALSPELNEYVLWFKPERIEEVTWAGNPDKAVIATDNGQYRIGPRKSFAAWTETVRNTSTPWSEAEVAAVIKLREDILQVVTRQANKIRLLNQRLQDAYEELDGFSYTVSHDLRTPLSSIRCYSEILLEEYGKDFNEDAQALFQKIIDSSDRMRGLIRHILYYSRMGRSDLDPQLIDMKTLLEGLRNETLLTQKDRSVTINISGTPAVYGDSVMIYQLFANLLGNATKYTQLTPEAVINIKGQQTDSEVIYSVEDNGIGFDMKYAGKIYDLFKRLENARQFEGSGVGMAIVKRIINRHQGKIWFHSEPNQGTTFSIAFPLPPTL